MSQLNQELLGFLEEIRERYGVEIALACKREFEQNPSAAESPDGILFKILIESSSGDIENLIGSADHPIGILED